MSSLAMRCERSFSVLCVEDAVSMDVVTTPTKRESMISDDSMTKMMQKVAARKGFA